MFIAKHTEASGIEEDMSSTTRTNSQPARSQHANKVPAGKEQHAPADAAYPLNDAVRALPDLLRRFAIWTTVSNKVPVYALLQDLR